MSLTNRINKKKDEKKVDNPDMSDKNVKLNEKKSAKKDASKRKDDKSNEITAIPELLKALDISGCIITIDAMGTVRHEVA